MKTVVRNLWSALLAAALFLPAAPSAVFAGDAPQAKASGSLMEKLRELGALRGEDSAPGAADAFVRYTEKDDGGALQLRDVTFEGPAGEKIELTAAIHVGDKDYYEGINTHLKQFDSVLFELVATREMIDAIQKGKKQAGAEVEPGSLADFYKILAKDVLHLTCQMEEVDYTLPTMVHADLLAEELGAAIKEGNIDASALLTPVSGWKLKLMLAAVKMLTPREDPAAVKRMLAPVFSRAGAMATGNPKLDDLIIHRRNARVLEVLEKQIAAGKRNLSIFYGAGHFAGLTAGLEAKGWKQTGEHWRTAWTVPAAPKP